MTTDSTYKGKLKNILTGKLPMSKEDFAYEALREAILSGALEAGQTLVQTEIAESLGISAIPVRSAIRRLISEGLVTQEPHRPPQVTTLSTEGLEEILVIRMHLETLATREALPRLSATQIAEIKELVAEMSGALHAGDMPRYGALNRRFHLKIYEACPFQLLNQMIRDLWDNSDRYRSRTMFGSVPGLAEQSQQDHIRLVELIEAGEFEAAVQLMEQHKTRARQLFLQKL